MNVSLSCCAKRSIQCRFFVILREAKRSRRTHTPLLVILAEGQNPCTRARCVVWSTGWRVPAGPSAQAPSSPAGLGGRARWVPGCGGVSSNRPPPATSPLSFCAASSLSSCAKSQGPCIFLVILADLFFVILRGAKRSRRTHASLFLSFCAKSQDPYAPSCHSDRRSESIDHAKSGQRWCSVGRRCQVWRRGRRRSVYGLCASHFWVLAFGQNDGRESCTLI